MIDSELGRELFDHIESRDLDSISLLCTDHADRKEAFLNWRNNDFTHLHIGCEKFGETPLIAAARRGNVELVSLLIEQGANVHLTDWKNKSALVHAKSRGHLQVVQRLIDAGLVDDEESSESVDSKRDAKVLQGDMVFNDVKVSPSKETLSHVLNHGRKRTTKKGPKPTKTSLLRAGLHLSTDIAPSLSPSSSPLPLSTAPSSGESPIENENYPSTYHHPYGYQDHYAAETISEGSSGREPLNNINQSKETNKSSITSPTTPVSSAPSSSLPRLHPIPSGVYVDPRFLLTAQDLREQQLIQQCPTLLTYYLCLQCGLHEALITCAALASDVFSTNPSLPAEVMNFLGSLIPLPFASTVFGIASKVTDAIIAQHMQQCYGHLRRVSPAADPVHSSRLVEGLARRLAIAYQDTLLAMTAKEDQSSSDLPANRSKGVINRLGISFLSKLQELLGSSTQQLSPEGLAAQHLKDLLHYLFSGKLQSEPLKIDLVIIELSSVIIHENNCVDGQVSYNPDTKELPTTASSKPVDNRPAKPPKPPKPGTFNKETNREEERNEVIFIADDAELSQLIPSGGIDIGADNGHVSTHVSGNNAACCIVS